MRKENFPWSDEKLPIWFISNVYFVDYVICFGICHFKKWLVFFVCNPCIGYMVGHVRAVSTVVLNSAVANSRINPWICEFSHDCRKDCKALGLSIITFQPVWHWTSNGFGVFLGLEYANPPNIRTNRQEDYILMESISHRNKIKE